MSALTWKKWRVGLWLAIGFGVLTAGIGGLTGNWKTFVSVLCSSVIGQVTSYLMKSPISDVQDSPS
jgi:hypothetical protein